MRKQTGFTIVELLIVIVVIAVLAAITIVAYNGIKSRSNDSSRLATINQIKKTVELYKAANGSYPACANGNSSCVSTSNTDGWGTFQNLGSYTGVTGLPDFKDPKNAAGQWGYYYILGCKKVSTSSYTCPATGQEYMVATRLENSTNTSFTGWDNSSLNYLDGS